jgi:hypothetical protein
VDISLDENGSRQTELEHEVTGCAASITKLGQDLEIVWSVNTGTEVEG